MMPRPPAMETAAKVSLGNSEHATLKGRIVNANKPTNPCLFHHVGFSLKPFNPVRAHQSDEGMGLGS